MQKLLAGSIMALAAAYVATYFLLIEPPDSGGPHYGDCDGPMCQAFFWPIHQADRLARRDLWNAPQPSRVGQIYLVGNDTIPDSEILRHVSLSPGMLLQFPEVRRSEARLAACGLFVGRPTVSVIEDDSGAVFKDIVVTVQEPRKTEREEESER